MWQLCEWSLENIPQKSRKRDRWYYFYYGFENIELKQLLGMFIRT